MLQRYVIVENGIVVNTVMATAEEAAIHGWIQSDVAALGSLNREPWTYDGTTLTPGVAKPEPPLTPQNVARALLRAKPGSTPITLKHLKDIGLL